MLPGHVLDHQRCALRVVDDRRRECGDRRLFVADDPEERPLGKYAEPNVVGADVARIPLNRWLKHWHRCLASLIDAVNDRHDRDVRHLKLCDAHPWTLVIAIVLAGAEGAYAVAAVASRKPLVSVVAHTASR